jgi:hypothetical protein
MNEALTIIISNQKRFALDDGVIAVAADVDVAVVFPASVVVAVPPRLPMPTPTLIPKREARCCCWCCFY